MTMPKWKEDFPIEWQQDNHITRREFMKFLTLTSLGLFVGNVWLLVKSWWRGREYYPEREIGDLSQVAVGGVLLFRYPRELDRAILLRLGEDRAVAYSQKCTHLACAVYWEKKRGRLECPCHEGYFSVENGAVLGGPPTRPLPRIELRIEGTRIFATGVRTA